VSDPDPYDLIFATPRFEDEAFPAITAEAGERGLSPDDPDTFKLLASVGELLRELPGAPEQPETAAARVDLGPFAALLFHAYQFARFGRRRWTLEPPLLEWLLGGDVHVGTWVLAPPHPAGYLRLPRQRLWSRLDDGGPPEPVHGFFWTMVGTEDAAKPPYARLDVLLCLGVREGRPGLSVIETAVALPADDSGHFADIEARAGDVDFGNILPGGELSGLHALVNRAEVLKLVSRAFWYVARHPASVTLSHDAALAGIAESHYVRLLETADG
jgi:hypothetical protein